LRGYGGLIWLIGARRRQFAIGFRNFAMAERGTVALKKSHTTNSIERLNVEIAAARVASVGP
jgi:hypothetical protein